MNLALPLLASVCLVLASCAPALRSDAGGRIVNVRTGQEGSVRFLGGFRDRASLPSDPDNVIVTLGDTVYSGRYTVLGYAAWGRSGPDLGLNVGFGTAFNAGYNDGLFGGGFQGSFRPAPPSQTRPGNLIARAPVAQSTSSQDAVQTLTCTFQTDDSQHGIGSCQDSAGGSYSLQF